LIISTPLKELPPALILSLLLDGIDASDKKTLCPMASPTEFEEKGDRVWPKWIGLN
jgi:hypothetical protein